MKQKVIGFKWAFFSVICSSVLFTSCKKVKTKSVEKTIEEGTWKITNLTDDGENETYYFAGYSFDFNSDGKVTATNGASTISGTWSVSKDNSNDDSSSDVDFNLSFPETNNFDELNDDWDIVTQNDNTLELKDVSGGNGGTDLLTFSKN